METQESSRDFRIGVPKVVDGIIQGVDKHLGVKKGSTNIFMLNSSVIFNNLYIANVMIFTIKSFLFMFPYYFIKDIQKGEEIQNNSFTGLGMQFPLLVYMKRAYLFSYH